MKRRSRVSLMGKGEFVDWHMKKKDMTKEAAAQKFMDDMHDPDIYRETVHGEICLAVHVGIDFVHEEAKSNKRSFEAVTDVDEQESSAYHKKAGICPDVPRGNTMVDVFMEGAASSSSTLPNPQEAASMPRVSSGSLSDACIAARPMAARFKQQGDGVRQAPPPSSSAASDPDQHAEKTGNPTRTRMTSKGPGRSREGLDVEEPEGDAMGVASEVEEDDVPTWLQEPGAVSVPKFIQWKKTLAKNLATFVKGEKNFNEKNGFLAKADDDFAKVKDADQICDIDYPAKKDAFVNAYQKIVDQIKGSSSWRQDKHLPAHLAMVVETRRSYLQAKTQVMEAAIALKEVRLEVKKPAEREVRARRYQCDKRARIWTEHGVPAALAHVWGKMYYAIESTEEMPDSFDEHLYARLGRRYDFTVCIRFKQRLKHKAKFGEPCSCERLRMISGSALSFGFSFVLRTTSIFGVRRQSGMGTCVYPEDN